MPPLCAARMRQAMPWDAAYGRRVVIFSTKSLSCQDPWEYFPASPPRGVPGRQPALPLHEVWPRPKTFTLSMIIISQYFHWLGIIGIMPWFYSTCPENGKQFESYARTFQPSDLARHYSVLSCKCSIFPGASADFPPHRRNTQKNQKYILRIPQIQSIKRPIQCFGTRPYSQQISF